MTTSANRLLGVIFVFVLLTSPATATPTATPTPAISPTPTETSAITPTPANTLTPTETPTVPLNLIPKIVFQKGSYPDAKPWICDLDGGNAAQLTSASLVSFPKIANGTVVFMSDDYQGSGPGIYKMDAVPGAAVSKIPNTDNIRTSQNFNWDGIDISPDGQRVAWTGNEPGDYYTNHGVYVVNMDGTEKTRILRNTDQHFTMLTWGEPNRICVQISSVGDAYSQRPYTVTPSGANLTQVVSDFVQSVHVGGPDGHAVLNVSQETPYLATYDNGFTTRVALPGPKYGFGLMSWHPTENTVFGSKNDGNLYRVDVNTGNQILLVTGVDQACGGGDVGAAMETSTITPTPTETPTPMEPLLPNGGFETLVGTTNQSPGVPFAYPAKDGIMSLETTDPHGGEACARQLVEAGNSNQYIVYFYNGPLYVVGKHLEASVWVKTQYGADGTDNFVSLRRHEYDTPVTVTVWDAEIARATGNQPSWVQMKGEFIVTGGAPNDATPLIDKQYLWLLLKHNVPGTTTASTIWWDDLALKEILPTTSTPTPTETPTATAITTPTPGPEGDLVVDGQTVTLSGKHTYGRVEVRNGGTIEVVDYAGGASEGWLEIHADSISIDSSSRIIADGKGYRGGMGVYYSRGHDGEGPGAGEGSGGCGTGGGYGGKGGAFDNLVGGGATYGTDSGFDIDMGSGGGGGGRNEGIGGDGGGKIALHAMTLDLQGTISANGNPGQLNSYGGGGGSGGGILIDGTTVSLSGAIQARGGDGLGGDNGVLGGGGGRIKVFYQSLTDSASYGVTGGAGSNGLAWRNGEAGTIHKSSGIFQTPTPTPVYTATSTATVTITPTPGPTGDLVVDGQTVTLSGNHTYGRVDVRNGGTIEVADYAGGASEGWLEIHADSISVDSSSCIIADGKGYRGGVGVYYSRGHDGEGPGAGEGSGGCGTGGGYGGKGGEFDNQTGGGATYGTNSGSDIDMGSGGGGGGRNEGIGGDGGGKIALHATILDLHGAISANGNPGQLNSYGGGGGSGGGILIDGTTVSLSGTLQARGGDGLGGDNGVLGGGGGRIKIFCKGLADHASYSVTGGAGSNGLAHRNGEVGTIYKSAEIFITPSPTRTPTATPTVTPTPTATSTPTPPPEVQVVDGTKVIANGRGLVIFETVVQGATPPSKMFAVWNMGQSPLITSNLTVPSGYSITSDLATTIPEGNMAIFSVQLLTDTVGPHSGTISFNNNDPHKNPFTFRIAGIVALSPTSTPTPRPTVTPIPSLSLTNLSRNGYATDQLQVGKLLYTDRTYIFTSPIPRIVSNQIYIRTSNADKDTTTPASFLSFDANQNVIVYIGIDQRITTIPTWLKSWTKSYEQLKTTDLGSTPRILYSKIFPKGKVILGPNRDISMPKGVSMYTVVITPNIAGTMNWTIYADHLGDLKDRQVSLLRE